MSAEIYYFSGAGNSFAAARDIAAKLKGDLIAIPSLMNQESIETDADVVGLVFPVYYAEYRGVPLIVWRFIEKLENLSSKYIFAVAVHSGGPDVTIQHLADHISNHGGKLSGGFTFKMDVPYPVSAKLKKAFFGKDLGDPSSYPGMAAEQKKVYQDWKLKLAEITSYVSSRGEGTLETLSPAAKALRAIFLPLRRLMFMGRYKQLAGESRKHFYELVPLADRSFRITENCNSCGICAKVCPVANIEITDGGPGWLHHCENCYACFKWCPENAISGKIVEYAIRNHHPGVGVKDFINQRQGG
ncbi:EFR1 family ferrodoxin [candidate division WOR-3 bacterium]|nr:EFR1 family ferrodoxin [candidate division WOR-3 bacterium]